MPKNCPACNRSNPDATNYCEECGAELLAAPPAGGVVPPVLPSTPEPASAPAGPGAAFVPARIVLKRFGALTNDIIPLEGSPLVLGRFDASTGPVDIDVTSLPGGENASRHHAELFMESGSWMVKEISSTNGVFVKRAGESSFSPRLQAPTALHHGDEVAFGNLVFMFQTS